MNGGSCNIRGDAIHALVLRPVDACVPWDLKAMACTTFCALRGGCMGCWRARTGSDPPEDLALCTDSRLRAREPGPWTQYDGPAEPRLRDTDAAEGPETAVIGKGNCTLKI
mmetsp:Transcript_41175/g.69216  ORF Transcript_41175/g.69216 Transcript_41175/m.69216 type:complete len:111 (+) Transcript_41175:119-451(+)